jgi:hypothetical protein
MSAVGRSRNSSAGSHRRAWPRVPDRVQDKAVAVLDEFADHALARQVEHVACLETPRWP